MIVIDLQKELHDVLPSLDDYINAKDEFKKGTITQSGVNAKLERLVVEINEFFAILVAYATDSSELDILKKAKTNI